MDDSHKSTYKIVMVIIVMSIIFGIFIGLVISLIVTNKTECADHTPDAITAPINVQEVDRWITEIDMMATRMTIDNQRAIWLAIR